MDKQRSSRRRSKGTRPDGQRADSSGSNANETAATDDGLQREIIARILSQIRACRDVHETDIKNKNPIKQDEVAVETVWEDRLDILNNTVQTVELQTTCGVPLEDLLKGQLNSGSEPPKSPQKVPVDSQRPLDPLAISVEDPSLPSSSNANLLAVNGVPQSTGPETNVERAARQEAFVVSRVAELRRNGLWSASLLPMVVEPARNKTHWDYVLEEVKWMANDFRQERILKKNVARKLAGSIAKQFRDREREVELAQEREVREAKRLCASVAKMVREFWINVDKVVDFRAKSIIESKKRRALDQHLKFLVGEADKISSLVQEGLEDRNSRTPSIEGHDPNDREFVASSDSESDDEETIAQEETALEGDADVESEMKDINKEGNLEFDDFLASLPPEYLASIGLGPGTMGSPKKGAETPVDSGEENDKEDEDEPEVKKARNEDDEMEVEEGREGVSMEKTEEEKELERKLESGEGSGDGRGVLAQVDFNKLNSENSEERQTELDNIAEEALKFQPKGFTLETTQVKTKVPFLMRGILREYQMVGLDWLVTLYENNLNGILADEMGLGKTIQTIALLAHLACEETVWGPHLIIVPTSVILNWEMEFKKWCPAMKILTYFGSNKERAEKRKGWLKPNSFHVCITSYKTVTTDIRSFKQRAWQYMILDEAQNIKNWKSQRWQALLNVRARRRLLLTGTPLQNSLMELWSLMHFLMPAIFSSHDDFKDWFSNPLTGMMEGSVEYNAPLVQRLHKVLRPFILRRLKAEVEKQLPSKTEHVVKCNLSKRQRYLYDDFMSRRTTRDNLRSGNMMSVLNIVMQLRKCCNHPNLFEPRPVVAPFAFRAETPILPGVLMELCGEDCRPDDKKHIPESFLLNSRLTGWSTSLKNDRPTIEELATFPSEVPPPKLDGFRFVRPSFEKNAGVSTPAQGPLRMPAVEPMETEEQVAEGGNVPLLVTRTAATAPQAPSLTSPGSANENVRQVKAGPRGTVYNPVSSTPSTSTTCTFRATTVITPMSPVAVVCEEGPSSSSATVPPYQFSPPLKRRRVPPLPVVSGRHAELVPSDVVGRLEEMRRCRLERARERFGLVAKPFYPQELVAVLGQELWIDGRTELSDERWQWHGWDVPVEEVQRRREEWLGEVMNRFLTRVDPVVCERGNAKWTAGRPAPAIHKEKMTEEIFRHVIDVQPDFVSRAIRSSRLLFPELRLIEYDCGKLQVLGRLLRELYLYKHRVLIFTQMSKMLDVLQAFLSFHGYQYFRLDGATPIEQRQAMMERFNADSKIFCFILSTRSGGVGVNLTGADTVVFYDSDWNPTMDAQAQDRCHRIGQTRNVSIYRLISERTIEENILKKATQKKRLGEMAIDEAGFTPDFFKKSDNIRDLFDGELDEKELHVPEDAPRDQKELEKAMASLEDEADVVAAKAVISETRAETAEFDENTRGGLPGTGDEEDDRYAELIQQLTPIERYAVAFLEEEYKPDFDEEVKEAEAMIDHKKDEWMKARTKAIEEEEEAEDPLTYTGGSLLDEIYCDELDFTDQFMSTWMPPTPPLSDSEFDAFVDQHWNLLYELDPMGESLLPDAILDPFNPLDKYAEPERPASPVMDDMSLNAVDSPPLQYNDITPESADTTTDMYDCTVPSVPPFTPTCTEFPPTPAPTDFSAQVKKEVPSTIQEDRLADVMDVIGKDSKTHIKSRSGARSSVVRTEMRSPMTPPPPEREDPEYEGPEWGIHEDYALLNAVSNEQRLTHSMRPGLQINWEYVAGVVNRTTGFYRSPRQCCLRYQCAVLPREEGRLIMTCPITRRHRKITLTPTELGHVRRGRTTTAQQYEHDEGKLIHERMLGKFREIGRMAHGRPQPFRRRTDVSRVAISAPIPIEHEMKLNDMGLSYGSVQLPTHQLEVKEEKRAQGEIRTREQFGYSTGLPQPVEEDAEPWSREVRISARQPAVPCPKELLTFRTNLVIEMPPPIRPYQPAVPPPELRAQPPEHVPLSAVPRRVTLGPAPHQSGANYVVVNNPDGSGNGRMATFVQRAEGAPGQPTTVFRTIAPVPQTQKRGQQGQQAQRMPVGYQTTSGGQPSVYSAADVQMMRATGMQQAVRQPGQQQNLQRVMQRVPTQPGTRMFVSPQQGERTTFVVPGGQQQLRMVTGRLPQKRTIGNKPQQQNIALMIPRGSSGQVGQIRQMPRYPGGGQNPRVMSVVAVPPRHDQHLQGRPVSQYVQHLSQQGPQQGTSGQQQGQHVGPSGARAVLAPSSMVRHLTTSQQQGAQGGGRSPHQSQAGSHPGTPQPHSNQLPSLQSQQGGSGPVYQLPPMSSAASHSPGPPTSMVQSIPPIQLVSASSVMSSQPSLSQAPPPQVTQASQDQPTQ